MEKKQWTHGRVEKAGNETMPNKTYAQYKQSEMNHKVKKNGKGLR